MKNSRVFMAISHGQESTEAVAYKNYIGIASCYVKCVNPNKEELSKLLEHEIEKEPEYISTDDQGIQQVRIDFRVQPDPEKYLDDEGNPINVILSVPLFLRNRKKVGAKSGKIQIIDKYGRTAWATQEEVDAKKVPMYKEGTMLANIDPNYRIAYDGEEELVSFIKTLLNIPNVEKWENGHVVGLIDHPENAECMLDHIDDYFKGNVSELKEILSYQPNNKIKINFGIRTTEDNRIFSAAYTKMFLLNNSTKYDRLDKAIQATKDNGGLQNVEFECTEFHEYKVEATNFAQEEAPAAGATPWGQAPQF